MTWNACTRPDQSVPKDLNKMRRFAKRKTNIFYLLNFSRKPSLLNYHQGHGASKIQSGGTCPEKGLARGCQWSYHNEVSCPSPIESLTWLLILSLRLRILQLGFSVKIITNNKNKQSLGPILYQDFT